jgi:hypothetical protein
MRFMQLYRLIYLDKQIFNGGSGERKTEDTVAVYICIYIYIYILFEKVNRN